MVREKMVDLFERIVGTLIMITVNDVPVVNVVSKDLDYKK